MLMLMLMNREKGTWQGGNLLEKGTSGGGQLLTMHLGLGHPDGEAEALLVRRQNPAQPVPSSAVLNPIAAVSSARFHDSK